MPCTASCRFCSSLALHNLRGSACDDALHWASPCAIYLCHQLVLPSHCAPAPIICPGFLVGLPSSQAWLEESLVHLKPSMTVQPHPLTSCHLPWLPAWLLFAQPWLQLWLPYAPPCAQPSPAHSPPTGPSASAMCEHTIEQHIQCTGTSCCRLAVHCPSLPINPTAAAMWDTTEGGPMHSSKQATDRLQPCQSSCTT